MPVKCQVFWLLLIWSLLTITSAGICCFCCLLPFWISGTVLLASSGGKLISSTSHLGLFRRCGYPNYRGDGEIDWKPGCGYYPSLKGVPHWVWRMALVLLVLSACLLVFLAVFVICAVTSSCILRKKVRLRRVCSSGYIVAGSLCLVACFAYPFGWSDNTEILQICGPESGVFKLGRCELGWAYVLTMAGGVISIAISGMPNLLHSIITRFAQAEATVANVSSKVGQLPPQPQIPFLPIPLSTSGGCSQPQWCRMGELRRMSHRPQSVIVLPEHFATSDSTQRMSCSVFGCLPQQQELPHRPAPLTPFPEYKSVPEEPDPTEQNFGAGLMPRPHTNNHD
uniref:LHFPL tetraspan subfamily member 6 n=1 Tax=Mesocestoides corti TaxID=53468 RepID=A0A5K3EKV5_MESCO